MILTSILAIICGISWHHGCVASLVLIIIYHLQYDAPRSLRTSQVYATSLRLEISAASKNHKINYKQLLNS